MKVFFALMVSVAMLVACGGGDSGSSDAGSSSDTPAPKAESKGTDISMYKGSVSGTVNFAGAAAPKMRPVNMDAECGAFHTDKPLSSEVIVNANKTLKNVFVYVKDGLGDKTFDPPSAPVVFDQRGCQYEPHVFGVQTGQNIKILNSDPLLHNIHALPTENRPFNFGMPKQGTEMERSFRKQEVMIKIKCDVHPWMGAYCGVVDHPYFSVSSDAGAFSLNNLPAGTYTLEAWHEKYGTATQSVTIADGEAKTVEFSFGG